jgi:hypothetical protein
VWTDDGWMKEEYDGRVSFKNGSSNWC